MKKNIALLIPTLMKGGAEKQSVLLANSLSKEYNVYFIVFLGDHMDSHLLNLLSIEKIRLIKLKKNYIGVLFDIYKVLKEKKINTIFSYLASGNFINGLIGGIAKVPNRVGGIRNAELSKFKLPLERFFHNKLLTHTISNSHSAVFKLEEKGFKKKKFHMIHNAFDLKQDLIVRNKKNNITILSVARFVPQKDYFTALESINLVKKALENSKFTFRYYIVGYGTEEKKIRNRINSLNLNNIVKLIINPKNVFDYFKKSDLFLTTSLYEGMSNSVMEAMSYSLPILATDAGDMKYLVKDNFNGFICSFKNPKAISEKVVELITDFDLRNKMGANSYITLKKRFNLQQFYGNYVTFLNSISHKEDGGCRF